MLAYYKKLVTNCIQISFVRSCENPASGDASNVDKVVNYLTCNGDKNEAATLYAKLSDVERKTVAERVKAQGQAKSKLEELRSDYNVSIGAETPKYDYSYNEIPKEKIPDKLDEINNFLDSTLTDGKLSDADIDTILARRGEIVALIEQSKTGEFAKTPEFLKKIDLLGGYISKLRSKYNQNIIVPGAIKNPEFDHFLTTCEQKMMQGIVNEIDHLKKELEGINGIPVLLDKYEAFKENKGFRTIILQDIIKKFVKDGKRLGYEITGDIMTKLDVGNKLVVLDKFGKKDNNTDLSRISQEDLKIIQIETIRNTLGIKKVELLNKENIVNELFIKYKSDIKDGKGNYTYNDLYDAEKKKKIIEAIETQLKKDDLTPEKRAELELLLDLSRNPVSNPAETNPDMIGQLAMMSEVVGHNGEKVDAGTMAQLAQRGGGDMSKGLFSMIMGANGGLTGTALIMISIVGLFMPSWRNYVLGGWGAVLLATTGEEVLRKLGLLEWAKQNIPGYKEITEKLGEVVEKGPDYTIKNLPLEYNYKEMYLQNRKKRETDKTNTLSEEAFAQIYGQMVNVPEFNSMSITDLEKITANNISSSPFKDKIPKEYKEGLLNTNNDKKQNPGKTISNREVMIFIQMLIKQRESTVPDEKVADLWVSGKKQIPEYVSGDDYKGENEAIMMIIESITYSEPKRQEIIDILKTTDNWNWLNLKASTEWTSINLGAKKEKIEGVIKSLELLGVAALTNPIVAELNKIKAKVELKTTINEYISGAKAVSDLRFGEETVKAMINGGSSYINRFVSWSQALPTMQLVPEANFSTPEQEDLDKLIETGKELLEDKKETKLTGEQKKEISELIEKLYAKKEEMYSESIKGETDATKKTPLETDKRASQYASIDFAPTEFVENVNTAIIEVSKLGENQNSFDDFSLVLSANIANIAFLREVSLLDANSITDTNAKTKIEEAKKALEQLDTFKTNFEAFVEIKKKAIETIQTSLTTPPTPPLTYDQLRQKKSELATLRSDIIRTSWFANSRVWMNENVFKTVFGYDNGQDKGTHNVIKVIKVMYNALQTDNKKDSTVDDLSALIDTVETAIKDKVEEVAKKKEKITKLITKAGEIKVLITGYDFTNTTNKTALENLMGEYKTLRGQATIELNDVNTDFGTTLTLDDFGDVGSETVFKAEFIKKVNEKLEEKKKTELEVIDFTKGVEAGVAGMRNILTGPYSIKGVDIYIKEAKDIFGIQESGLDGIAQIKEAITKKREDFEKMTVDKHTGIKSVFHSYIAFIKGKIIDLNIKDKEALKQVGFTFKSDGTLDKEPADNTIKIGDFAKFVIGDGGLGGLSLFEGGNNSTNLNDFRTRIKEFIF